jgi:membrane associated rhomboid family serine protease
MSQVSTTPQGKAEPESLGHISARGDIELRVTALKIIGWLIALVLLGGIAGLIFNEPAFGKYWTGLLPIISGGIFGLLGFVVGRSTRGSDS